MRPRADLTPRPGTSPHAHGLFPCLSHAAQHAAHPRVHAAAAGGRSQGPDSHPDDPINHYKHELICEACDRLRGRAKTYAIPEHFRLAIWIDYSCVDQARGARAWSSRMERVQQARAWSARWLDPNGTHALAPVKCHAHH